MKAIRELALVAIPEGVAADAEVKAQGTVVWAMEGASIATIECQCIHNNPDGLATKLLDIAVDDLKLISD